MTELTLHTFWGTPLIVLPAAILLALVVHVRIAALVTTARTVPGRESLAARARLLARASAATGFAVAASALAAMTSGVCVVFRIHSQVPVLAMQALALAAMIVSAAALTVESSAALRELTGR